MIISNFIKTIMKKDLQQNKISEIITRFPPEPNGFLHLGHARAIIINFELAKLFQGKTYLRYDDTNPIREKSIYIENIQKDINWLGYKPDKIFFTSDYFEIIYQKAILLIQKNKAFVDDLNTEELKKTREMQQCSPYRNRSISENLKLFIQMAQGKFQIGAKVLRAKIDMSSPNINLRDPVLYRILNTKSLKQQHYYIYPTYDFAHPLADSVEKITHSLCSLEFEDHRPLYNWIIKETEMIHIPQQIEFGRLNIVGTCLSKRILKLLVDYNLVQGWDDPRMPTLIGLRNRGLTPLAIKNFIIEAGLSKINSNIDKNMLDACLRNDLQLKTKTIIAIIKPLKITITNYPENKIEYREIPYYKNNEQTKRKVFFSRNIYIEHSDFEINKPNKDFKRLFLNGEVRLLYFYFIKAYKIITNESGEIIEILATYDPITKSGSGFNQRKPNGTIHFLTIENSSEATFNFYQDLLLKNTYELNKQKPEEIKFFFNFNSWVQKKGFIENTLDFKNNLEKFQFIRHGFFNLEHKNNQIRNFNEIVALKKNIKY
ncbi:MULTISPECIES: glutamine--tRNA ligase [Candidatus Phytoplasma]|uniref:Glutamine--tRNA ligase n=2 Tax=Candidatus Phytoplasma TaxID=33926 RepID=A0ABP2THF8_PEWBP|nr:MULTISPECIES: glutamine--tRNA ligase [Phytoplasma]QLL36928.1 glutaminyl-tRNA synthetase ['Echinacea purpurea' witches'-broom phytoplasma]WKV64176.1 MAG: glutaminyl-tRNA synthetase [Candidatus Phytoplasma australasiaticum]EMR14753.1 glutaminyl-tRNA synthetase [Peanut witches'-broom phytoplasma NTU2011]MDO8052545.1 glutamine--tRNA ligase ['Vigna radiata' phytoplasma]MDO8054970.1 glutamine--tRNA ligase ['Cleome sp.' phytoplasma]